MKKSRGNPILVCNCSRPHGTPLLVDLCQKILSSRVNDIDYRCLFKNLKVNDEVTRFTGNCPSCGKFVEVRIKEDIVASIRLSDNVEWMYDNYPINKLCSVLSGRYTYAHINIYDNVEYLSPHVRIIPQVEQKYVARAVVCEIPSPSGLQKLRVDSHNKRAFAEMYFHVIAGKFSEEVMPDWYPGGTEKDFGNWYSELEKIGSPNRYHAKIEAITQNKAVPTDE